MPVLSYIFGSLEATERAFRHQAKINRAVALFVLATGAYVYYQNKKIKALEAKIDKLRVEED